MESVWWVFKELYGKGQIYRGFSVSSLRGKTTQKKEKHYTNMVIYVDYALFYWLHDAHVEL